MFPAKGCGSESGDRHWASFLALADALLCMHGMFSPDIAGNWRDRHVSMGAAALVHSRQCCLKGKGLPLGALHSAIYFFSHPKKYSFIQIMVLKMQCVLIMLALEQNERECELYINICIFDTARNGSTLKEWMYADLRKQKIYVEWKPLCVFKRGANPLGLLKSFLKMRMFLIVHKSRC